MSLKCLSMSTNYDGLGNSEEGVPIAKPIKVKPSVITVNSRIRRKYQIRRNTFIEVRQKDRGEDKNKKSAQTHSRSFLMACVRSKSSFPPQLQQQQHNIR